MMISAHSLSARWSIYAGADEQPQIFQALQQHDQVPATSLLKKKNQEGIKTYWKFARLNLQSKTTTRKSSRTISIYYLFCKFNMHLKGYCELPQRRMHIDQNT